jgi:putative ABC transport system ATP-binding protein
LEQIVRARGVRKVFRDGTEVEALRGVDFGAARGEMVAIMGPSGSGKTTLLNCLAGLEHVDDGEILIDGSDMAGLSDDRRTEYRARHMGFVFQAFNLLPVLTAVENVEIPLLLLGERARTARRRAEEILAQVGLAERVDHRPEQLSGGEQQRVAVARALVHRPAVVWADEPTGNLDTESTEAVMDLLVGMNSEGQTIVLVTHNPAVASRTARTVRLRDGQIERTVPPSARPPKGKGRLDPRRLLRTLRTAWGPSGQSEQ